MAHPRYVGLRLSTEAGAAPTAADMAEGELAINVADGRVYTIAGSAVIDLTDRYTAAEIDDLLGGKADASHAHQWDEVTSKPSTATRWPTFAEVTDKPDDYPPSSHSHTLSEITDAGSAAAEDASAFDAAGSAQAAQEHAVQRSSHTGTQPLATISDAGTAAAADTSDFDPAGSAAQVEHDIRDTLRQRPDPLLMHFL